MVFDFAPVARLSLRPRYFLTFLKPSDPSEGPSDDSVVDGEVSLTVTTPRRIKQTSIDVELLGTQTLTIRGKYVKYPTLHLKTTLDLKEGVLEAGTHTFRYAMICPANTAPKERLGVFQNDIKKDSLAPHGGNVRARTHHMIRATAHGLGAFGKDLTEEREIILQANANKEGLAQGFSRTEEMLHPSLGPLRIRLYTKYLLIHGFLRASIYVPSAAQACTIVDIRVALSQQVRLENLTNPREFEEPNPYVMSLWRLSNEVEHEDGIKLAEGEKLDVHRVVRLPTDNSIRQSTSEWSETGIRVSHKLAVYVTYALAEGSASETETKELMVRFDAKISSCDAIQPNVSVPDYRSATSREGIQRSITGKPGCLCMMENGLVGADELRKEYGLLEEVDEAEEARLGTPGQGLPPTKWEQEEEERLGREAVGELMRHRDGIIVDDKDADLGREKKKV